MLKFYVSSDKKDFTNPIMVMGKTDMYCIKTIYKYFYKNNYKGVPIPII